MHKIITSAASFFLLPLRLLLAVLIADSIQKKTRAGPRPSRTWVSLTNVKRTNAQNDIGFEVNCVVKQHRPETSVEGVDHAIRKML